MGRGEPSSVQMGDRYGRWTVTGSFIREGGNNDAVFPCTCNCGTKKSLKFRRLQEILKSYPEASCGCYHAEVKAKQRKHGVEPWTPEWDLARRLRTRYKLSLKDFYSMKIQQDNCCAICEVNFDTLSSNEIHVDHDHSCCDPNTLGRRGLCGKCNREILCRYCNYGLGNFRDNRTILSKAAEYLLKHETTITD